MKLQLHDLRIRCVCLLALTCLWAGFVWPGHARGEDTSGMSLNVYTDPSHQGTDYALGDDPVKLVMVIKNISEWPVNTDRGFSQIELQRSLVVTDPGGTRYSLSQETLALTPAHPLYLYDFATSPAETLPEGWVRSVTIADLTELFTMMGKTPGWYTIEAHQPFVRYAWIIQDDQLGKLAIQDDARNWYGTIDSNQIQVNIVPGDGGNPRVRVLDACQQPPAPIAQVPVKLFKGDIGEDGLADAWANPEAVLSGTTNPEGWAIWDSGAPCVQKSVYTAIALHQNEYKTASFADADGWASGCEAVIEKEIHFEAPPASNDFSVYALNSAWIQSKAIVITGNIGVEGDNSLEWLDGWEVLISENAQASQGVQILGKSVRILEGATVWDVFYQDQLDNKGTIRGQAEKVENLVVATRLPSFRSITPGQVPLTVGQNETMQLTEGSYGDVTVKAKATLRLKGGIYHFKSLNLDPNSELNCSKPTEIRLEGCLFSGPDVYVVPKGADPTPPLSAKDVFIYVNGQNGDDGAIGSEPKAAEIGTKNNIKANIYAPNGTLWIKNRSVVEGSFIAKDVIIGEKATVRLDSAF
jgi:hypothetical protein